ncbi:DUF7669 domain-containing protein [Anaerosolibacter sp.]|uniref:DUF7669 domain-containing protein n=1 Tax=Anaerosolibacter sp. TaxID=1872527 RepID=UPI0039EF439A
MGLFRLNYTKEDLSDGFMEKANKEPIDYEKDFENWLENSPHVLFEDDASTIMWIGRQVSTTSYETTKFPDLIGIDSNGDVVIVELKKGRTPREVVAQILEYAAWASRLTYEDLNVLTMKYFEKDEQYDGMELAEIHNSIFNPDDEVVRPTKFNQKMRLYIVAEEITKTVRDVVKYLNSNGGIDINCMKYEVFRASNGEFYISTEMDEADIPTAKSIGSTRSNAAGWNGDVPVKQIVKNAVEAVLKGKNDGTFTGKEIIGQVVKIYPDCNQSTIRCQLYADCVNHSSRKHYKGGQLDLYYSIGNGRFRLYDRKNDGIWNAEGERIG